MARLILGTHHIDIYYYELTEDGFFIDRNVDMDDVVTAIHKYSDVFPLKNCMLGGVKMKCPAEPKKFLLIVYGKRRGDVTSPNKKCVQNKWIDVNL